MDKVEIILVAIRLTSIVYKYNNGEFYFIEPFDNIAFEWLMEELQFVHSQSGDDYYTDRYELTVGDNKLILYVYFKD
ncbi:MAG: hypothetical protein KDH96_12680 [Candidatus Riesia sp.]|nr:hypothetical protein [Candidatus Riesia sp.]